MDESLAGKSFDEKIHFADWYSIFSSLAGVDDDCSDDVALGVPNIDGMDLSESLLRANPSDTAKRRVVLPIASDTLIVEDEDTGVEWKIVQSAEYQGKGLGYWQQDVWPSADSYFPDHINDTDVACLSELGCLFNLSEDPLERHDLGWSSPTSCTR